MTERIRWGLLGTGFAARSFAQGLKTVPEGQLQAVGSRALSRATAFANDFAIPHRFGSYSDLVNDKTVDVVFIATPNHRHLDDCTLALEAGKAVLCEKPFSLNCDQARRMVTMARERRLFCMEAMWTRFIPLVMKLPGLLSSGIIGEPTVLQVNLGFASRFDPRSRLFPAVGKGTTPAIRKGTT